MYRFRVQPIFIYYVTKSLVRTKQTMHPLISMSTTQTDLNMKVWGCIGLTVPVQIVINLIEIERFSRFANIHDLCGDPGRPKNFLERLKRQLQKNATKGPTGPEISQITERTLLDVKFEMFLSPWNEQVSPPKADIMKTEMYTSCVFSFITLAVKHISQRSGIKGPAGNSTFNT